LIGLVDVVQFDDRFHNYFAPDRSEFALDP